MLRRGTESPRGLNGIQGIQMGISSGGFRGGRARRAPPPPPPHGPKFSQFHAVFRKIWQNHMLRPSLEGWRPLLRGILDPPLIRGMGCKG